MKYKEYDNIWLKLLELMGFYALLPNMANNRKMLAFKESVEALLKGIDKENYPHAIESLARFMIGDSIGQKVFEFYIDVFIHAGQGRGALTDTEQALLSFIENLPQTERSGFAINLLKKLEREPEAKGVPFIICEAKGSQLKEGTLWFDSLKHCMLYAERDELCARILTALLEEFPRVEAFWNFSEALRANEKKWPQIIVRAISDRHNKDVRLITVGDERDAAIEQLVRFCIRDNAELTTAQRVEAIKFFLEMTSFSPRKSLRQIIQKGSIVLDTNDATIAAKVFDHLDTYLSNPEEGSVSFMELFPRIP